MIDATVLERHGLKPDEYDRIVTFMGREPNLTELGMSIWWQGACGNVRQDVAIAPGRKGAACAGQDQRAQILVQVQPAQFGEQRLLHFEIGGVKLVWPVERQDPHRADGFGKDCFAHAAAFASALNRGMICSPISRIVVMVCSCVIWLYWATPINSSMPISA